MAHTSDTVETVERIENLTKEELNEKFIQFNELVQSELEIAKNLKDGEDYDFKSNVRFWQGTSISSENIYGLEMDEAIEVLNDFKEKTKVLENRRNFYVDNEEDLDVEYDSNYAYVNYIRYVAYWTEPKESISDTEINKYFRKYIKKWLAPEGINTFEIREVDCKLLTLFKEGHIDWNTLRTLVYSDCKL